MTSVIDLTPTQSVSVYGWKSPLRVLNWKTVIERDDLSFHYLFHEIHLTGKQLQSIQSDIQQWIEHKRFTLNDVTSVPCWKVHVIKDFNAGIGQIAMLNLSHDFLQQTGVTFEDLVHAGLTLNLMMLFRFNLLSWIQLGLYRDFLNDLTDLQSMALFQIPKNLVLQSVLENDNNNNARRMKK
jgi:hypothetical protein